MPRALGVTENQYFARPRLVKAQHDLQKRRFAAAVRPDQARQAAGLNRECHVFEGRAPVIASAEVAHVYGAFTV